MEKVAQWTDREKELLCKIALENSQVYYILGDADVAGFYRKLLSGLRSPGEFAKKLRSAMEQK